MTMTPHDPYLTMGEAARQFGTSTKTLKRLLKEAGTPVLHLTRNVQVKQSDLDQLMEARVRPLS